MDEISMNDEEVGFLLHYIKNMDVVEIGTYEGKTAEKLAQQNNEVITIDPYEEGYDNNDKASLMNLEIVKRKAISRLKKYDNILLFHIPSYVLQETWKMPFDALLIDGDHSPKGIYNDLKWISLINDGGIIAIHDYENITFPHIKEIIDKEIVPKYKLIGRKGLLIIFKKEEI